MRQGVLFSAAMVYLLAITTIMFINTTYFGFGDSRQGGDSWKIHGYTWALYYAPLLLYGLTLNFMKNERIKDLIKCNSVFIALLVIVIELSFINDVSWSLIAVEYVLVGVVWIYVLKLKKYLTARFS